MAAVRTRPPRSVPFSPTPEPARRIPAVDPADELVERFDAVLTELSQEAAKVRLLFAEVQKEGAKHASHTITAEIARALDRALARRQPWLLARVSLVSALCALVVVAILAYWTKPFCVSDHGGRFCGVWVTSPRNE